MNTLNDIRDLCIKLAVDFELEYDPECGKWGACIVATPETTAGATKHTKFGSIFVGGVEVEDVLERTIKAIGRRLA